MTKTHHTLTKTQVLLCLAIGHLSGAAIWNQPAVAWDLASGFADLVNGIHDSLSPGRGQAQTPLPVPQEQPPNATRHEVLGDVGNFASRQPCAAPPPATATQTEEMPTASNQSTSSSGIKRYSDPEARVLMNTAPGNRMSSLLNRVSYPDRFDDKANYWDTENGTIAVTNDDNDRVTAIWMVK